MTQTSLKHSADFDISTIKDRREPAKVFITTPQYFDVVDVKNVHMLGHKGKIDKLKATEQWNQLEFLYTNLRKEGALEEVSRLKGKPDCEDMVFCANQTFPWVKNGEKVVLMSNMKHLSRQKEVSFYESFFKNIGYKILHINPSLVFEGMGDAIPHPEKSLIYCGYGHRTSLEATEALSQILETPVIALQLVNPKFYHLDTCFLPISTETLLICKEAFNSEDQNILQKFFKNIILIPEEETEEYFALNAHCIYDSSKKIKKAIIQKGSTKTVVALKNEGYEVLETDTSEFMKSGGSVFCMKMMYY